MGDISILVFRQMKMAVSATVSGNQDTKGKVAQITIVQRYRVQIWH